MSSEMLQDSLHMNNEHMKLTRDQLEYPALEPISSESTIDTEGPIIDDYEETLEEISTQEAERLKISLEPKVCIKTRQSEEPATPEHIEKAIELTMDDKHEDCFEEHQAEEIEEFIVDDKKNDAFFNESTAPILPPATPSPVTEDKKPKVEVIPPATTGNSYILISSDEEEDWDGENNSDDADTGKKEESEDDIDKYFPYDDYHDLFLDPAPSPSPEPEKEKVSYQEIDVDEELEKLYEQIYGQPEVIELSDDEEEDKVTVKTEGGYSGSKRLNEYQASKDKIEDDDDFMAALQLPTFPSKKQKSIVYSQH